MSVTITETVMAELQTARRRTTDPAQENSLAHVSRHLAEHRADALARTGGPAHLTASCFVFDETLEEVLLSFHRKGRFWVQFGGHIEATDSSLREAAERELREESGLRGDVRLSRLALDADIHDLPSAFGSCRTHLDLAFGAMTSRDAPTVVSDESDDVGWHRIDALPYGSVPGLADRASRVREAMRRARRRAVGTGAASAL